MKTEIKNLKELAKEATEMRGFSIIDVEQAEDVSCYNIIKIYNGVKDIIYYNLNYIEAYYLLTGMTEF